MNRGETNEQDEENISRSASESSARRRHILGLICFSPVFGISEGHGPRAMVIGSIIFAIVAVAIARLTRRIDARGPVSYFLFVATIAIAAVTSAIITRRIC